VHEVDVLGQRLAQRLGHRLDAPVGHEPAADLGLDLLLELLDAGLELVVLESLLQRAERSRGILAGGLHEALEHGVGVDVPQRAVQVVGAPHRPARLHARVAGDGLPRQRPHQGVVALEQGPVEHLGELLLGHGVARPALATLARAGPIPVAIALAELVELLVVVLVDGVLGAPHREVDLEDRLEGPPVRVVLHQGGAQRVLEGLTVLEGRVGQRLHGVEVLGEADRQAGLTELDDEPGQQVEQGVAGQGRVDGGVGHGAQLFEAAGPPRAQLLPSALNSLTALAMSVWYLSRMLRVSVAWASSICSTPSSIRVLAQSSVSDTDGDFLSSSCRIERTMRAI
jgi:hypothetical protein